MRDLLKRIVTGLVTIVLAAAILPAVKAQNPSRDASAERERLSRIMDPATDVEEFRRELDSFYADLQTSMNALLEGEFARDLMARAGLDPLGQLADARKMLPELTAQDLGLLKAAFARNPEWREMPDRINSVFSPGVRKTLKGMSAPQAQGRIFNMKVTPDRVTALPGGIIKDNCIPFAEDPDGTPHISNSDIGVVAGLEVVAAGAADAIPDTLVPAHIVAIVADGVAKGVLQTAQTMKGISDDCLNLDFQNYVTANLDEQVSTRASQTSVNDLTTSLQDLPTSVSNVQTSVNIALNSLNIMQTTVNNLQTTSNTILANLGASSNEVGTIDHKVDTLQQGVNLVNSKIDAVSSKVDQFVASLASFQAQNLRLAIEANLSNGTDDAAIGLFELPAAQGGYLDLARSIVAETIQKMQATGQTIGNAQALLTRGDQQRAAGNFKDAYDSYRQAYRMETGH
jgi:hypothetical protein